jgi:hypothetical protein
LASFPNLLSPLQQRILTVVSGQLSGLFLSGGTALGAFHLGHRRSADLDLFTRDPDHYAERVTQFTILMEAEGLDLAPGSAGPGFRRFVVSDGNEEVPVDLVLDTAARISPPVVTPQGLVVDSLDDITANKLATILGRSEVRDYVDLFFIARAGRDPLLSLPAARAKDGGVDAATLAFVLSEVKVKRPPEGLEDPISAEELQAFIDGLRAALARQAFPGS